MDKILEILQREDGALSLLRVFAVISFLSLIFLTYVEFVINKPCAHYAEFASFTFAIVALAAGKNVAEIKSGLGSVTKKGASI